MGLMFRRGKATLVGRGELQFFVSRQKRENTHKRRKKEENRVPMDLGKGKKTGANR